MNPRTDRLGHLCRNTLTPWLGSNPMARFKGNDYTPVWLIFSHYFRSDWNACVQVRGRLISKSGRLVSKVARFVSKYIYLKGMRIFNNLR